MSNALAFLGRICISWIFLGAAYSKITNFSGTQQYMTAAGMPATGLFLVGAIFLLTVGGLSVLLGLKPRWGAVLLIVFLVPATVIFHAFWKDPAQQGAFIKNLAIIGGLLMIAAHGGGKWGVENYCPLCKSRISASK